MSVVRRRRVATPAPAPEVKPTTRTAQRVASRVAAKTAPKPEPVDEDATAKPEREPLTQEEVDVLKDMATRATLALISQNPVSVTRHNDEPRDGMPLPIRRAEPDTKGMVTQLYRPIAILEYVDGKLASNHSLLKRLNGTEETV